MLNRAQAPSFKTIDTINIIKANHTKFSNGIDFYSLSAGSQEIVKIEFIFKAGMYHQAASLIASSTNNLLEVGSKSYSANQISDGIDFYGSFLELHVEQDFAIVSLFSLNKYLNESLKFIEELIKYPTFPDDEFKLYITNKKQNHFINSQKGDVLVRRKFSQLLYGEKHPYGLTVVDNDFDRINISEIKDFFSQNYNPDLAIGKIANYPKKNKKHNNIRPIFLKEISTSLN